MTAHNAGCTTSTRSSACASASASASDQLVKGLSARAQSRILAANTGDVSIRPTAMPAHWEPCPGNMNTTSRVPGDATP